MCNHAFKDITDLSYVHFTPLIWTKQDCLVRVGGVNRIGDKSKLLVTEKFKTVFLVSKCGVNRDLSCIDAVSNFQLGLVYKCVHSADRTGHNCSVSNILRTTENSLVVDNLATENFETVLCSLKMW